MNPNTAAALKLLRSKVEGKGLFKVFRTIDADRNGSLDRAELHDALSNRMNLGMTEDQVQLLVNHFDKDGDGAVDYEEMCRALDSKAKGDDFWVARKKVAQKTDGPSIARTQGFSKHTFLSAEQVIEMLRRRVEQQNKLRDTFELFDLDRSGSIDKTEMQEGLAATLGVSLTDHEAGRLFSCFDEDGSGEVEYKEVFQWLDSDRALRQPRRKRKVKGDGLVGVEKEATQVAIEVAPFSEEILKKKEKLLEDPILREAVTQVCSRMSMMRGKMLDAFKRLDKDRSGSLDYNEMQDCFDESGIKVDPLQFTQLMKFWDTNSDGDVDLDEFKHALEFDNRKGSKDSLTQLNGQLARLVQIAEEKERAKVRNAVPLREHISNKRPVHRRMNKPFVDTCRTVMPVHKSAPSYLSDASRLMTTQKEASMKATFKPGGAALPMTDVEQDRNRRVVRQEALRVRKSAAEQRITNMLTTAQEKVFKADSVRLATINRQREDYFNRTQVSSTWVTRTFG